jgi:hypothetical protein
MGAHLYWENEKGQKLDGTVVHVGKSKLVLEDKRGEVHLVHAFNAWTEDSEKLGQGLDQDRRKGNTPTSDKPASIAESLAAAGKAEAEHTKKWAGELDKLPVGTTIKGHTLTDVQGDKFWIDDKTGQKGLTHAQLLNTVGLGAVEKAVQEAKNNPPDASSSDAAPNASRLKATEPYSPRSARPGSTKRDRLRDDKQKRRRWAAPLDRLPKDIGQLSPGLIGERAETGITTPPTADVEPGRHR